MIPNITIRKIRDLISDELIEGGVGTGITLPLRTDTGLETAATDWNNSLSSKIVSSNSINMVHIIELGENDGLTLTEWEIIGSDGTNYNRVIKGDILKDTTQEVHMIQTFIFEVMP